MKLSIIIPAFNEEKTIELLLEKLTRLSLPDITTDIIVVDDGSTDSTYKKALQFSNKKNVRIFRHKKNAGKGKAIQTGIRQADGDIILIQDADMEYDPKYIPKIVEPIANKKELVVFGSRLNEKPIFFGKNRTLFLHHYYGNKALSLITSLLYGQKVTDMETGYKAFHKSVLKNVTLKSRTFDVEPEITAKIMKKNIRIHEISIKTIPRGYQEGKKLHTVKDGCKAVWTIFKYRFVE